MKKIVAIVDYGLGNILSAKNSFFKVSENHKIDLEIIVTDNPKDLKYSTHIVLPGQGAFKSCIDGLLSIPGMEQELTKKVIDDKTPFLGICVGMQLLANISFENGKHNRKSVEILNMFWTLDRPYDMLDFRLAKWQVGF